MCRLPLPLILAVLVVGVVALPSPIVGQEPLPTPRGQLGGPVRLEPTATGPTPGPPTPTMPPATATPTEATATPTAAAAATEAVLTAVTGEPTAGTDLTIEEVVDRVGPSVVTVVANGAGRRTQTGSGIVIDQAGHVVTARSVIENAGEVTVTLASGQSLTAQVVGADEGTDLALLRVDGELPPAAALGDEAGLRPGQSILAFGNAYGVLPNTVTGGIVSAVDRAVPEGPPATTLIQHDAPIVPGGEGGPLVALDGTVVGINVAVALGGPAFDFPDLPELPELPDIDLPEIPEIDLEIPGLSRTGRPTPGVSFAVPASTVRRVVEELIATDRGERAEL